MIVAIIPAKEHSRRVPKKNYRDFMGKPMFAHSIQTARESGLFGSVIVSTDSEEISEIAQSHGADVMMRGERWCRDDVGPLDVARHCLSLMAGVSLVAVIYAAAPLMSVHDLRRGHRAVTTGGAAFAFSCGTTPFLHDSAQFFWCHAWALRERVPEFAESTLMVPIAPERDCDINEEIDLQRAELMYEALHAEKLCA